MDSGLRAPAALPESERRKAARVYFEPLRVRVRGTREGILVDLSDGGALVLFPTAVAAGEIMALQIDWKDTVLRVDARVKRCLSHPVQLATATMARTLYDLAVEFVDVPPETAAAIRRILMHNASAAS